MQETMNNPANSEKTAARCLVEASAWRAYLAEHGLESTPAFETWLADARNHEAWDRVQQSWDLFGAHAASPELLDLRRRALGRAREMGRERWSENPQMSRFKRVAIAAGLAFLVVAGFAIFDSLRPDVYRTDMGERRVLTLADGSQVQLDSLTELHVDYSKHARNLQLIRGQARFDVAHDVERPFVVVAAGRKVVATGTAFNVDLLGKDLYVTLLEGKVVVLPKEASAPRPQPAASSPPENGSALPKLRPMPQPHNSIELQAGQQLAISEDGETMVAQASVQRVTAWQSGQLVFEDEPLSSVVARVNRYSTRPVTLIDEKMASLRISGVFNTGDVDGFISTVTHYLPIKTEQGNNAIYLSERSGTGVSGQSR